MKKSEIMQIIREEVQVVLTNEEAIEMFDLDPAALLDEMMKEEFNIEDLMWGPGAEEMERNQKRTDQKLGRIRNPRRGGKVVSDFKTLDADHRDPSEEDMIARLRLEEDDLEEEQADWMGKIKSTGECTPFTKPGCKGRAKAFARRAQHGDVRDDNLKQGKNPDGPG